MKNWSIKKLSDVCEITSSKRIFASEYVNEGIPFYRGKEVIEMFNGSLEVSTDLFISLEKYNQIKSKFPVPVIGDLLLTSVGTLGVPYIVKDSQPFYFKDGNLTWFRNFKEVESFFVYYWLTSSLGKEQLNKATIGSSQSAYTIKLLSSLEILLPDVATQKTITSILSNYDDLIQINQQRITLLEEAAQRLYDEWFVKLRFPNHEQVPVVDGVPEGWERGTVYDFADILSGGTPKTTNTEFWDGDIPFFTPKDSPSSFFTFSCEKTITQAGLKSCNSPLYPENSLFITARGTVGKICLAGVPMAMNQSCYSIKPKQNFSPYYFYLALQRSIAQIKQTANGGVFDAIIVDTFRSIDMLRPNLHLAESFSVMIEPFFGQMKSLIIQNQKLMQARDDLLPRLMSGRLDVSTLSAVGEE